MRLNVFKLKVNTTADLLAANLENCLADVCPQRNDKAD